MDKDKKKKQTETIELLKQLNEKGLAIAQCAVSTALAMQQMEAKKPA